MVTRRPSVERIPPSRHAEIGTVSSSQYIDLNFPALHRSCFFQLHVHISHESTILGYIRASGAPTLTLTQRPQI